MKIRFLGAADTVTGSRHLVDIGGQRILLDCGLYQGYKVLRERNWAPFAEDVKQIEAVVLSHGHLDHCGYLPALVKQGFKGPIYTSAGTRGLAELILLDSAKLQEHDARRANKYGYSRHEKALPLYTTADARRAIGQMQVIPTGRHLRVGAVEVQLTSVGHLLGASAITLRSSAESLVFSGDLGRVDDTHMPAPETVDGANVLLIESTYGNRLHANTDPQPLLGQIVRETAHRGGSVLLPSFAVGRAQALLHSLQGLRDSGQIPKDIPIFLDSPMAIEATALYLKHRSMMRLSPRQARALTDGVIMVRTPAQSEKLTRLRYPCIIISASGMATGGRVLHHLKAMAPDARNHIVFAGFQVGGTRGDKMVRGAAEVKIHGEMVPIRATVSQLEGLSGHADADGLMAWMRAMTHAPRQVFVVHGEREASDALRFRIQQELGWRACVPEYESTHQA